MKKNEGQVADACSGTVVTADEGSGEIGTFLIHRNSHTDVVTASQTEPLAKRPAVLLMHFFFFKAFAG